MWWQHFWELHKKDLSRLAKVREPFLKSVDFISQSDISWKKFITLHRGGRPTKITHACNIVRGHIHWLMFVFRNLPRGCWPTTIALLKEQHYNPASAAHPICEIWACFKKYRGCTWNNDDNWNRLQSPHNPNEYKRKRMDGVTAVWKLLNIHSSFMLTGL